jgi:hypothetical protein
MRFQWLLVTTVALVPTLIQANDMPTRKPGLWEMTWTSDVDNSPTPAQDDGQPHLSLQRVTRICTDENFKEFYTRVGEPMHQARCSKHEVHKQGAQVTIDTVCSIAHSQVTSHAVMSFDDPNTVTLQIHSHYEPAVHGRTETNKTQTGKWLGACPADMKPGDVLFQNGVKTNDSRMLESTPR